MIRILQFEGLAPEEILNRDIRAEADVEAVVDEIIARVRQKGDEALLEYAEKFDHVKLESLTVTKEEIDEAMAAADPSPLNALCEELLRPRLRALLFGCREERLDENQRFVLDFAMHAVMDQLRRMLLSRRPLDLSEAQAKAVCLLETFGLDGAERNNAVHIAGA